MQSSTMTNHYLVSVFVDEDGDQRESFLYSFQDKTKNNIVVLHKTLCENNDVLYWLFNCVEHNGKKITSTRWKRMTVDQQLSAFYSLLHDQPFVSIQVIKCTML
jgi:hypothetical protein